MSANIEDTELRSLLKEEYMRIQIFTESFDSLAMTVKAWSVTFSLAALVGAFTSHRLSVVLISAISAIGFWVTEIYVRLYQYAYYDRQGKIEKYFRGEGKTITPMQMGVDWYESFKKKKRPRKLLEISLWPEVFLPHVISFLVATFVYILGLAGKFSV